MKKGTNRRDEGGKHELILALKTWQCYLEPYSYEEVATIPKKDRDLKMERKAAGFTDVNQNALVP